MSRWEEEKEGQTRRSQVKGTESGDTGADGKDPAVVRVTRRGIGWMLSGLCTPSSPVHVTRRYHGGSRGVGNAKEWDVDFLGPSHEGVVVPGQ